MERKKQEAKEVMSIIIGIILIINTFFIIIPTISASPEDNPTICLINPLQGVDGDTSGWSTGGNTKNLQTDHWELLNGAATVRGYTRIRDVEKLTHRGTRGLGVSGHEYDEIDSYDRPEVIEIKFDIPHFIDYLEVRSLFANDAGWHGVEEGDIEYYLDGFLFQTSHLLGTEDFYQSGTHGIANVTFDIPILVDKIIFWVDPTLCTDPDKSEFAVAKINAWLPPCPENVWVDDDWNNQTDLEIYDDLLWKYNAFNTIQESVNAVCECGNVTVYNGTYEESVTIMKNLNLIGEPDAIIKCPNEPEDIYIEESPDLYEYCVAILGGKYEEGITSIKGDGWADVDSSWLAKPRHGGAGGYRAELGRGPGDRDMLWTGGFVPWISGETYDFLLDYNATTDLATFTLAEGAYELSYAIDGSEGNIGITGKSCPEIGMRTILGNVTLNGLDVGPDNGFICESDGNIITKHLLISGADLTSGFILEGDFCFEYDTNPKDEAPAIQIEIENYTVSNMGNDTVWGSETLTVDMGGFIIDANNYTASDRWASILLRNLNNDYCESFSNIHDNALINIDYDGDESFGGVAESFGIIGYGNLDIKIENNTIDGFARGGIGINSGYVEIIDNTVIGPGLGVPVTWAPNGIQMGYGAYGSIVNNDVSGCGWPGTEWAGTGIMVVDTSNVVVDGNYVHNNEQGIAVVDYPEVLYGSKWSGIVTDIDIINNEVDYNEWGLAICNDASNVDVLWNVFFNTTYDAIDVYDYEIWYPNYDIPDPQDIIINHNRLEREHCIQAGVGLWVSDTVSDIVDARWNWWGQDNGPSGNEVDYYTDRVANGFGEQIIGTVVNFDPWAGVDAIIKTDKISIIEGEIVLFDGTDSFAYHLDGIPIDFMQYTWTIHAGENLIQNDNEVFGFMFENPGTYQVDLAITSFDPELDYMDDNALNDYNAVFITVSSREQPEPLLAFADPEINDGVISDQGDGYQGKSGEPIQFNGLATGGLPPYSFEWNFGDGTISELQNPYHNYETAGEYTITLTVIDENGEIATDTTTVEIEEADIGPDDNTEEPPVDIKNVNAGFGVSAMVNNPTSDPIDWNIQIDGKMVFFNTASGTIQPKNNEEIRTSKLPPVLGLGKIDIIITAGEIIKEYKGFIIGPYILNLQ